MESAGGLFLNSAFHQELFTQVKSDISIVNSEKHWKGYILQS